MLPLTHLPAPPCPALSLLQARVLATMTEGGSEDRLFYGAAGQFVDKLAEVGTPASLLCNAAPDSTPSASLACSA